MAIDPINKKLGAEQGLRDGEFKQDIVSLSKAADMRKPILEALDKLRFDRAR